MRKLVVNTGMAVLFTILAIWLLSPSRNVAGNPSFEEVWAECTDPSSGTKFTLYRGNGGATNSFWYSVTSDPSGFSPERQIFFSYSVPVITGLRCSPESLELLSDDKSITIEVERIADLRRTPLAYYRGGHYAPPAFQPYRLFPIASGGVFLLFALILAGRAYRARRPAG